MNVRFFVCWLLILLLVSPSLAIARTNLKSSENANNRFIRPSAKAEKWAEKTLRKMSVDEKIGQTISIGLNAQFLNEDGEQFAEIRRQIVQNKIGGVCLFGSPVYEAVRLTNRMQSLANVPLIVSADFEAGIGMRFADTVNFPWNMAVAATNEPELARREGEITAKEARALGVQQIFAPVVDVNNNAANPVINVRSYGENPADVARFATAFINGLQSNNALATAKHFPGHGDTAVDSHRGLPIIDLPRSRFDQIEFAPFKAAIDADVSSIMISHISVPQLDRTEIRLLAKPIKSIYAETEVQTAAATLPATLSPVVQTEILRKQLGFRGLIVTDAMDMSGLTQYVNQDEAAARAFAAGADVILKPADADAAIRGLRDAVNAGRISQNRLDESVRKILALKYELGLVDNRLASFDAVDKTVGGKAARDLADEIATKAMTLVRNDALPLASKDKKIFVLGITNGDDRNFIANTFLRSLTQSGVKFESIILDERATPDELKTAADKARAADVVIAPMFGRVRTGAKSSVGLPDNPAKLLRELLAEKRAVVGISFGNPYLLLNFADLQTYLVAYGDMPSLQRAAARAILGQQNITGKLPITLPGLHSRGTGIQLPPTAK